VFGKKKQQGIYSKKKYWSLCEAATNGASLFSGMLWILIKVFQFWKEQAWTNPCIRRWSFLFLWTTKIERRG